MTTKIDMSAEAVTGRMVALDQLWELAVSLQSSKIVGSSRSVNNIGLDRPVEAENDPLPDVGTSDEDPQDASDS